MFARDATEIIEIYRTRRCAAHLGTRQMYHTRRRSVRIRAAATETACESSSTVAVSQTRAEAPGTSLAGNHRGQVAQRVVEMVCGKRRELNVLAGNRPYRRPVIGECDLRLARTELGQVVTPDPAAEL